MISIPKQILAALVTFALIAALLAGAYWRGYERGVDVERGVDAKAIEAHQAKADELLKAAISKNQALLQEQQDNAKKVSETYEAKILDLDNQYRAARDARGLRVAVTCPTYSDSGRTSAKGADGPNEAAAEQDVSQPLTERLPELTEGRLYDLAHDADELAEQLRALQAWVLKSGLY